MGDTLKSALTAEERTAIATLRTQIGTTYGLKLVAVLTVCDACERLAQENARLRDEQIGSLATVLLDEFNGPTQDEGACEMAIRVLREQRAEVTRYHDAAEHAEALAARYKAALELLRAPFDALLIAEVKMFDGHAEERAEQALALARDLAQGWMKQLLRPVTFGTTRHLRQWLKRFLK